MPGLKSCLHFNFVNTVNFFLLILVILIHRITKTLILLPLSEMKAITDSYKVILPYHFIISFD